MSDELPQSLEDLANHGVFLSYSGPNYKVGFWKEDGIIHISPGKELCASPPYERLGYILNTPSIASLDSSDEFETTIVLENGANYIIHSVNSLPGRAESQPNVSYVAHSLLKPPSK